MWCNYLPMINRVMKSTSSELHCCRSPHLVWPWRWQRKVSPNLQIHTEDGTYFRVTLRYINIKVGIIWCSCCRNERCAVRTMPVSTENTFAPVLVKTEIHGIMWYCVLLHYLSVAGILVHQQRQPRPLFKADPNNEFRGSRLGPGPNTSSPIGEVQ